MATPLRGRAPVAAADGRRPLLRWQAAALGAVVVVQMVSAATALTGWQDRRPPQRWAAMSDDGDRDHSAELRGGDSAATEVRGTDGQGTTPPATQPTDRGPSGPAPETAGEEPPPGLNPVVVVSTGPKGSPGSGRSGTPSIAPAQPGTTVFKSDDPKVTGDERGRQHVMVNDGRTVERVTDDRPGTEFGGVTAGPSTCGPGHVIVYAARLRDDGETDFPVHLVVRDRRSGTEQRLPLPSGATGDPSDVTIAPDCSVVVWTQGGDVYGTDRNAPGTPAVLVSGGGGGTTPVVSDAGGCIAFASRRAGVVAGDTNGVSDVFLRRGVFTADPADDQVVLVSHSISGGPADGPSLRPSIATGCFVAYESAATNLVPDDRNGTRDVFLYDPVSGTNQAVTAGDGPSGEPSLAGNGRYVTFASSATDLVGPTADFGRGIGPGVATGATPTNFSAFDRTGRLVYGTSILAVDGPRVRVAFPAAFDLGQATGATVEAGALIDAQVLPLDSADGRSNTNPVGTRAVAGPGGDDMTDGPDLVAAAVAVDDRATPDDPADDIPAVRFCFDRPVAALPGAGLADSPLGEVATDRYGLTGYNSTVGLRSDRARLEAGDPARCVLATFAGGVDLTRFTLGTVRSGAVVDRDGRPSGKSARPLGGTAVAPGPGDVTGPNLRRADRNVGLNQVQYGFDHLARVAPVTDVAGRFAFVDGQGVLHRGQTVAAVDPAQATVTVSFASDRDPLVLARRYVVFPDAVRSATDEPNVEQSTDGDAPGPELVSAARVGTSTPAQFDFTFNGPVSRPQAARFRLYAPDGTGFDAESATQPRRNTVRVTAPAVDAFAAAVVLGVAQPDAVRGGAPLAGLLASPAEAGNPLGVKPISAPPPLPESMTDGPDLVGVTVDAATLTIDYLFDEDVRDVHLAPELPDSGDVARVPIRQTDVFVRFFGLPRTIGVSVDRLGRPVQGSSFTPAISTDGRHVTFASVAPGLAAIPGGTNIYRRDLLVPAPSPLRVDFGTVTVGTPTGAGVTVTMTNRGFGALDITRTRIAGSDRGHFTVVGDGCSRRTLLPDERCQVTVGFLTTTDGPRRANLVFEDNAIGSPRPVPLIATALSPYAPTLRVSPAVGPPGAVVTVTGQGFPPAVNVVVRWAKSPLRLAGPTPLTNAAKAITDSAGRLPPTFLAIFSNDVLGPRLVEVVADRPDATARLPFLVVPGTVQPFADGTTYLAPELVIRR